MIVTPSRLHAVRYLLEFKRQIQEKGYTDLDVLVAFSGEVEDDGEKYTEEKMNKNICRYIELERLRDAPFVSSLRASIFGG